MIIWLKSHAGDKRLARTIDGKTVDTMVFPDGTVVPYKNKLNIEDCVVKHWIPASQEDIDAIIRIIEEKIFKLELDLNILKEKDLPQQVIDAWGLKDKLPNRV